MKNVLIVDDNVASLKQIEVLLKGSYNYSMAKSGPQALSICARERPDIIILDVEMPEMSGFETMARLRGDPRLAGIPVIFLTANLDTATEVKGFELGARDFLKKPVIKQVLLHRLQLHLNISSHHSHLEESVRILTDSLSSAFS